MSESEDSSSSVSSMEEQESSWKCLGCNTNNNTDEYICTNCSNPRYDHSECIKLLKAQKLENDILKQEVESLENDEPDANNMFQKLLDAEFEYEEEIERLHLQIESIREEIETEYMTQLSTVKLLCGYSINQLIPKKLNNMAKSKYMRIFHGYVRLNCDKQIPFDIIETIASFYPISMTLDI